MLLLTIKEFLENQGVSLEDAGVDGYGLNRQDAIAFIDLLKKNSIGILGGDVYNLSNGKLSLTYDNWYCLKDDYLNHEDFVMESYEDSKAYVEGYNERQAEVYYKIVFDDQEEGN